MLNFQNIKIMALIIVLSLSSSACTMMNIMSVVPYGPEPNLTSIEVGAPRADMEVQLGKPACKATKDSFGIESVIYSFDLRIKDTTGWLEVGYDNEDKVKDYLYSHFKSEVCKTVFTLTPPPPEPEKVCGDMETCN